MLRGRAKVEEIAGKEYQGGLGRYKGGKIERGGIKGAGCV